MAITKRLFIFATFLISGTAAIMSVVAFITEEWIVADVHLGLIHWGQSQVKYGLFGGTYKRAVGGIIFYQLSTVCLFSKNACAMLCENTREDGVNTLQSLTTTGSKGISFNIHCPRVTRNVITFDDDLRIVNTNTKTASDLEFINAGLWLTTVIFLVISFVFGLLAAGLGLRNAFRNPVGPFLKIFWLYLCNFMACGFSLMAIILWGTLYGSTLVNNICVLETIIDTGNSRGIALLGYSYWLNFLAFLLYGLSAVVLAIRQYLLENAQAKKEDIDRNDAGRDMLMM